VPQCLTPGMEDWFGKEGRGREGVGRGRRYELRGRRERGKERRKEGKKGSELSSMMTEGKRGSSRGGESTEKPKSCCTFSFKRISGRVKITRII